MNGIVELAIKIVLAAFLAFWLYRDAKARDYSFMVWTFLPVIVLLTPQPVLAVIYLALILVFYLILRPKGPLTRCPHCQKPIHDILTVCPFCRKNAKRECLQCHEPVPWAAEQCPYCKSRALTNG